VRGREDVFFGYEFDIQDGGRRLPAYARRYYIRLFARSRSALRGSFEFYPRVGRDACTEPAACEATARDARPWDRRSVELECSRRQGNATSGERRAHSRHPRGGALGGRAGPKSAGGISPRVLGATPRGSESF
jgi:hypothetical protein